MRIKVMSLMLAVGCGSFWPGVEASVLMTQQAPQPLTFQVRHDHDPWGACRGSLVFSEAGIEYESRHEKHSRQFSWGDIQSFDRISDNRFSILTWEDQKWILGLDRKFDFTVPPGEEPLSQEAFELVEAHLERPVVDRVPSPVEPEYQIGAKHLHTWGGCRGRLLFTSERVNFESEDPRHSRSWRLDRDVHSFWSPNRYQLEIEVFEESHARFDKAKRFRFQLERALDPEYYQRLRQAQLNRP